MRKKHAREKLLFRYSSALQRGDFTTLAAILAEAERDVVLARQLAEIDAALAAETIPPLVSTFSRNGHQKEKTVYLQAAPKLRTGRFNLSLVYAVAALVVVLLGSFLVVNRPGGNGDSFGGLAAQATFTPTPLATLPPTFTPTPFLPTVVPPTGGISVLPAVGGNDLRVICAAQTNAEIATEVRSLPTLQQGIVVGFVPISTAVSVVDVYQADAEGWYYIVVEVLGSRVQGWTPANTLITNAECVYQYSENNGVIQITYIVQPGDTLLAIAARYGLAVSDLPHLLAINNLSEDALPAPGQALIIEVPSNRPAALRFGGETQPPLDGMFLTATAIVQEATAQIAAQMTMTASP